MICLTGDIHHSSLKTNEQRYLQPGDSEAGIARRYLELVEKYKIKVTFYVTGRTFKDEYEDCKAFIDSKYVEIGGHTYNGIPLAPLRKLLYKVTGICPPSHARRHGSRSCQKKDIRKMINIVKKRTGRTIESWRSHGLIFDEHTYPLLSECGIKAISDEVNATKSYPLYTPEGLVSHPLNVIMDHDHLYHAHRDEEFVKSAKARGYGADDFGDDSYTIDQWGKVVMEQVKKIEDKNGVATVLMHPVCMYVADKFKTAEKLFKFFSQYDNIWAKELPAYMPALSQN